LTKHFQTVSLKGFGIADLKEGVIASGAILYYLSETQHNKVQHITDSTYFRRCLWMDRFTIRILNCITVIIKCSHATVIDKTLSPMGGRLLKRWLALPKTVIKYEAVMRLFSYLQENQEVLQKCKTK
jgi:DNA mismatch repair protein MutS